MKITLEMLLTSFYTKHNHHINNIYPAFTPEEFPKQLDTVKDIPLSGVRLFPKQVHSITENYLYVADMISSDDFKKINQTIPVICFSKYDAADNSLSDFTNIIWISTSLEFADAFNTLQECYHDFINWGKELDFAVFRDANFQDILDVASSMLDALILIYDPALKLLAYTKKYENLNNKIFQNARKNGYMELETFKYFEEHNVFEELNKSGTASGPADSFRDHMDKLKTININNELAVYCVLLYTSDFPKTYINALFQVVCDTIYNLLSKQHSTFKKDRSVTDYFLMDLLNHPDTPPEQIQERLYYNDLDYYGNYMLMSIHSDIRKKSSEKYFIQLLRNNLINCRIFSFRQNIVILYHLPQTRQYNYKKYIVQEMYPLLQTSANNNLRVFISRPFANLNYFAAAYQQAENIYAIFQEYLLPTDTPCIQKESGSELESGQGFYFYADYCLADLFYQNNSNHPLFHYCEPFLLELLEQNTKKSRQSLEILYEYLKNDRKLTSVAEKLNMHRNNVLYHVQQISENYQINLDDYTTRLKLLLSFELLKLSSTGNPPGRA